MCREGRARNRVPEDLQRALGGGLEGLLPRAAGCRKKVPKLLQVRPASRARDTGMRAGMPLPASAD